jgi:3D (Asp-Asp-Asp) domain-containing protein
MVKVILRSLVFRNPTQVQLIRGDPRYKLMSPEEVIGKFVSFELMIKGSKQIIEQGGTSTPKVQPVAFKATEEKKEESTSSRLPIDASKLDNEEMTLIIRSFRQILKQRRGKDYKPRSKKVCCECGKPGHFIAKCPISMIVTGAMTRRERGRKIRSTTRRRAAIPTCVGNGTPTRAPLTPPPTRMPPTSSSTRDFSFPTSATNASWQRTARKRRYKLEPLPSILHLVMRVALVMMKITCLVFLPTLTCNKKKLNELICAIHEKDELLDSQEEFLIKENKKHVKVKNAYAQEMEKNKNLTKELSICQDTISNHRTENVSLIAKVEKSNVCHNSIINLKNDNASLIAKIDKLNESIASLKTENDKLISKAKDLNVCNNTVSNLRNENVILHAKIDELNACKPSTSTVAHVSICTRCRDINVDVIHVHLALIKQQNDHIAQLTAKINEHEIENEKFKFARSMLYNGRRLGIKNVIGFQQGSNVKLNAPKRLSNFVKGKAPMAQDNEGYILYPAGSSEHKIRRIHARKSHYVSHHAFMYKNEASSSRHSTHVKMPKKKTPIASNEPNVSFKTFDASYVLTNKLGKVVAKYVGGKHKGSKTCVWVPKVLVSNMKGPKTVWVPKNKA